MEPFILFDEITENIKYSMILYFKNLCQKKRRKLYKRKKKRPIN